MSHRSAGEWSIKEAACASTVMIAAAPDSMRKDGEMFCPECGKLNDDQARFCNQCGANLQNIAPVPAVQQKVVSPTTTEYAGFWKRCAASLIDLIVIPSACYIASLIICFVAMWVIIKLGGRQAKAETVVEGMASVVIPVVTLGIPWLYYAVMESSSRQATLGKMAVGIIVTDLEGDRISFARATARHWAKIISGLILLIGFVVAGFTERKQALHDMIAECLVVVKK